MKVGDIVRHKLSPEAGRLRIDKISTVAVCSLIDDDKVRNIRYEWVYPTAICKLENLEPITTEPQLTLFV